MALPTIDLRVAVRFAASAICVIGAACAWGDVFASSGLRPVTIAVESDTVVPLFTSPEIPLTIRVTVGGKELADPQLTLSSSDSGVIEPNAAGDSVIGRGIGRAVITISLKGSMFTDTLPTLSQGFRVRP